MQRQELRVERDFIQIWEFWSAGRLIRAFKGVEKSFSCLFHASLVQHALLKSLAIAQTSSLFALHPSTAYSVFE